MTPSRRCAARLCLRGQAGQLVQQVARGLWHHSRRGIALALQAPALQQPPILPTHPCLPWWPPILQASAWHLLEYASCSEQRFGEVARIALEGML